MNWLEPGTTWTAHLTKGARWWRKHGASWREANAEKLREYHRNYVKSNPARREYLLQKQRERRAKLKEVANAA